MKSCTCAVLNSIAGVLDFVDLSFAVIRAAEVVEQEHRCRWSTVGVRCDELRSGKSQVQYQENLPCLFRRVQIFHGKTSDNCKGRHVTRTIQDLFIRTCV